MNKIVISALMIVGLSSVAHAEQHTVSVGYAQSKISDTNGINDLKGVNLKYRYEYQNSPWSAITSFTAMTSNTTDDELPFWSEESDVKNYSLSAGPAYRLNDYFSLYGLLGLNFNKTDVDLTILGNNINDSSKTVALMYGAGIQINPTSNFAIDVGYEGSSFEFDSKTYRINGFNIGLGYRF